MMTVYVFKTLFPDQVTEFAMIDKTTYYEVTFCKVRTVIIIFPKFLWFKWKLHIFTGNKYWTFHDRDIAPEGATWQETNRNLDEMVELAAQLQKQHGVKLLWATCNLFSHPRYCAVIGQWSPLLRTS